MYQARWSAPGALDLPRLGEPIGGELADRLSSAVPCTSLGDSALACDERMADERVEPVSSLRCGVIDVWGRRDRFTDPRPLVTQPRGTCVEATLENSQTAEVRLLPASSRP